MKDKDNFLTKKEALEFLKISNYRFKKLKKSGFLIENFLTKTYKKELLVDLLELRLDYFFELRKFKEMIEEDDRQDISTI